MPNHCVNFTTVTGPVDDIQRFYDAVLVPDEDINENTTDCFCLARLFPIPEDKIGDSYWWCVENWGTKWGDYNYLTGDDEDIWQAPDTLSFSYHTAYAPFSENFWQKVTNDWPTLYFTTSYQEEGIGVLGAIAASDGLVEMNDIEHPEFDGPFDGDEYLDFVDEVDRLRNEACDTVIEMLDARLAVNK